MISMVRLIIMTLDHCSFNTKLATRYLLGVTLPLSNHSYHFCTEKSNSDSENEIFVYREVDGL